MSDPTKYIEEFLEILEKPGCYITEEKIRNSFGWKKEKTLTAEPLLSVNLFKDIAIIRLIDEELTDRNKSNDDTELKIILKFQKTLKKALSLADYPIIQDLLFKYFVSLKEGLPREIMISEYENTLKGMNKIHRNIETLLHNPKRPGRPPLIDLYNYIHAIIDIYEKLSDKKFSILRHSEKSTDGKHEYSYITAGHRFVGCAMKLLHDEAKEKGCTKEYTDKNIYNVCEKIITKNNKIKKPR